MSGEEPATQIAPVESPQMVSTVKLPILKKGEYTLWSMRMEQYLTNTDYSLWQVILNGDGPIQVTTNEKGIETEYQLRFHGIKDAESLWAAIKSRFGGNVESKKMQKTVLKQQFENFSVFDIEGLDAYDRFQKLISLLEVHGAAVPNKDANQKFLRALPSSWNNVALIMKNKDGIDDLDIDDLYNNLKLFEADIKGSFGSSSNSQNVAFLSTKDTSSSNEVNIANGSNSPQLDDEDLEQIDHDDLEEMDLKWECRAPRNQGNSNRDAGYRSRDNTRRTVPVETSDDALVVQDNALIVQDRLGYDWSYIAQDEPTEFALMAYTSNSLGSDTEVQSCSKNCVKTYEKLQKQFDEQRQTLSKANLEIIAYQLGLESIEAYQLISKDKTGLGYGDQLNENDSSGSELFNSVFDSHSSDGDDNQTNDRYKKDNGYHVVPPPLTGNYMPLLADLSFAGLDDFVYRPTTNKTSASMPSGVIIEDWVSDDEDIFQYNDLQATDKPSLKRIEFSNARNESVKPKQAEKPRITTQNPKVDRRDWNKKMTQKMRLGFGFTKKAYFVCGSYSHLKKDCGFHEKRMAKKSVLKNIGKNSGQREIRPVWNSAQRINHQNKFVPSAVLTRFGRVPVSAVKQSSLRATASTSTFRPVNTATHTNRVNLSKLKTNAFHKSYSPIRRPFYKSTAPNTRISNEKVNTVRVNGVNTARQRAVSTVKGTRVTADKASADIDGGFVAFGGSARGGKITGKGKIRIDKLDFEDVFFVKELNFNLFSVSQMCGKKNSVFFTETECLVLSPDFKLLDESQVLLRVPRQSNMYSFDLKNVVPSRDLTCLFAKATIDESKLWHGRLGHVKFKTMNKLVKGNLVRGLPSKILENDHTCIVCQKGKQHKASCKAKLVSSISQPLQMLHMDLFGPTSVKSINNKTYCLVVTDDFSRFSWVFFLASKDETSGILKRFITKIENQLNHKVKVIRCDNGTKFKNREMNEFCRLKGIKREFSVARTPQQNGVAKRKNRTLIEAARTMLVDSLLPTVFWAKAVNTACYVLNRVLVTKPHNKTPYELIIGRPPSVSFMRPFGCSVTILNTLDHLGKFNGKAEEGFLVGYFVNSKAFKVFNSQTRKVKENLHVNFLENKPNVVGQGPNWIFDIDSLTNSMNYQPVTVGNQTNKNAGPQEANGDTDETYKNDTADDAAGETPVQKPASENQQTLKNVLDKMMDQEKEAKEQSDTVRKEFKSLCNRQNLSGKTTRASSTNSFNTVSTPVNVVGAPRTSNDAGPSFIPLGGSFPDDPLMPDLEDTAEVQNTGVFGSACDDDDLDTYNSPYAGQVIGAEVDFNNMEPSIVVSPIPSTRVHSIHPKDQIIRDPRSAVQTRGMKKKSSREHAMISYIQKKRRTNHKDFQNCLFASMDVKSAFLYGTIKEEVYVSQPPGFVDPEFPKSLQVEKAFIWSTPSPRAWERIQVLVLGAVDTMGGVLGSERVLEQPIEPPLSEGHTSRSREGRMEHQFELMANVPITPHDSPLPGGYIPRSDEGRLKLQELMTMCTKLSKQVLDLEKEKDAQAVEILRLKKRVKRLERQRKSSTSQPRRRKYRQVESSDDDLNEEDVQ
ncbi:putative ribonuclease H-like domain-containing protein [Tanacetum coccineum]